MIKLNNKNRYVSVHSYGKLLTTIFKFKSFGNFEILMKLRFLEKYYDYFSNEISEIFGSF